MSGQVIVAFDIEAAGHSEQAHGLVAVGVCVLLGGEVIHKQRWVVVREEGKSFEPRCLQEFWMKNPHLLRTFEREEKKWTVRDMAVDVGLLMDDIYDKYTPQRVTIVSDTSVFDLPWLFKVMDNSGVEPLGYH